MAHGKGNRRGILYNRRSISLLPAWSKSGTLFQWLMEKEIEEESFTTGDVLPQITYFPSTKIFRAGESEH